MGEYHYYVKRQSWNRKILFPKRGAKRGRISCREEKRPTGDRSPEKKSTGPGYITGKPKPRYQTQHQKEGK